jgi:hypothetical protein
MCVLFHQLFPLLPNLLHFRAGWTCLHYASYHGHANVVAELLRFASSKGFLRALISRKVSIINVHGHQGDGFIDLHFCFHCDDAMVDLVIAVKLMAVMMAVATCATIL